MRYAVISDIHGNLEAFESVLESISKEKVEGFLFIGDVVGYGADPAGCIKILRSLECEYMVAGNHEWGALGLLDLDYFNDVTRAAVVWTRDRLNPSDARYLKSIPIKADGPGFEMVHGSLESPEEFYYIRSPKDAKETAGLMKKEICFIGHTHRPGIFSIDRDRVDFFKNGVTMESGKLYVVNAGSVGQPRDGEARASYAIYDTKKKEIGIKRVDYDLRRSQQKIIETGLPRFLADRLARGA